MITLWQFRASPYNEKVRWALDLKRVTHRRRSFLPGLHVGAIKSRTGQTATPILQLNGKWLSGSAAIVAALEERFPNPPLFPKDAAMRAAVLEIEKRFDDDFGPRMRRATFGQLLQAPSYLARVFAAGRSALVQAAYGAIIPLAELSRLWDRRCGQPIRASIFRNALHHRRDWTEPRFRHRRVAVLEGWPRCAGRDAGAL